MNKPVGKVIFVPLGAVRSTERFDIVTDVRGEVDWNVVAVGVGVEVRRKVEGRRVRERNLKNEMKSPSESWRSCPLQLILSFSLSRTSRGSC